MANYQGGGSGQRTYESASFTPPKKPGKKKAKAKASSKSKAKQQAIQGYTRPPANYQVPTGTNPLLAMLAQAGGPSQSQPLVSPSIGGGSRPPMPYAGGNTYGYNDVVPSTNPFLSMMQKAGIRPANSPYGGTTSGALAGGAYGAGGSTYNSQVPSAARPTTTHPSPANGPGYGLHESGAMAGPTGDRPPTPADLLAQLTAGSEYKPQADNTDYYAQAQAVYDPQSDYLNDLDAKARAQAKASSKTIGEIYAELTGSIGKNAGAIKQSYKEATDQGNAAYDEAYDKSQQTFDNSRNGVADTLQRLGIEEAAPNTTQQGAEMQQLMQGIIGANDMAQDNAMTQGRQSALDYNSAMQSGSTIRGGDAQYGLASQLGGFLNELGLKKADLASQIQQLAMTSKSDADKTAYERWRDQQGFDIQRAGLAQEAGQWAGDNQFRYDELGQKANAPGQEPDYASMQPGEALVARARALYPNEQAAGNAVKAVQDVAKYAQNSGADIRTLDGFLNELRRLNPTANDIGPLTQMATDYWLKTYKGS